MNSSEKHIKFLSSGYYSPLYISALIRLFYLAFQGLSRWEASVTLYLWFRFLGMIAICRRFRSPEGVINSSCRNYVFF